MSYAKPTELELRISRGMTEFAKFIHNELQTRFDGEIDFILTVTPKRTEAPNDELSEQPVTMYAATSDRETSAMCLVELIAKWQSNGDLPPLHELTDAEGKSILDVLGISETDIQ